MTGVLLVAAGGALGAVARYGLVSAVRPHAREFPVGTLACNLLGCLAIGVLAGVLGVTGSEHERARLLVFTGILGGFTTFSSFGIETIAMVREGRVGTALAYIALSNVLGLLLVWVGWRATG